MLSIKNHSIETMIYNFSFPHTHFQTQSQKEWSPCLADNNKTTTGINVKLEHHNVL